MKVCSRCGAQNQDQAAVCYACGTQFAPPQAAPYQQPMYNPMAPAKVPGKGFGIAALVCGIVSFFFAGIILGILAIIFGAVAKNKGYRGGMATAGIVLGVIGLALTLVIMIACQSALATFGFYM